MPRIAQVLVNIPTRKINKVFSYRIPEGLAFIEPGWRVWVPFGTRRTEGFVTAVEEAAIDSDLKEILEVWDTQPWFNRHMLEVAAWIQKYYLCSQGEALRLFVPGGSSKISEITYKAVPEAEAEVDETAHAILQFVLRNGSARHENLLKRFGADTVKILRILLQKGLLVKEVTAKAKTEALFRSEYRLVLEPEAAAGMLKEMRAKPAQKRAIDYLLANQVLKEGQLTDARIAKPVLAKLIQAGAVVEERVRIMRDSYSHILAEDRPHTLTGEQAQALSHISGALRKQEYQAFLLHGITGSGKTEVYITAAAEARSYNRQVIVLVPEIALTSQIVHRFKIRFGDDVTVIHSKLSLGERQDAWERMRQGTAGIVIGARSAVFAPFPDPGLIILDEEHEFTYKQEETPRYHAREVALVRARLAGAAVILGSATPALETYHRALTKEFFLLEMPSRINSQLPSVSVVDMREELQKGNRSVLSGALLEMLRESLARQEQSILLLNRRGHSTFVLCRECGHVIACNHCSVSMVYHEKGKRLRCHYCQRTSQTPDECPVCRSRYIRYFGSGTQKVEEELARLLPEARVLRMDQDTTGRRFAIDTMLSDFTQRRYDILLGTQMVAKGHDIENVTAVGIISADTALNLPDFRAAEKSFALIMQAAGRAGRGDKPGRVVVQTYNPEHYAIQAGARQDYSMFYQAEIAYRQALAYPPYSRLVKITVYGPDEAGLRRQAEDLAALLKLQVSGVNTQVLGPFTAAVAKIDGVFRINILLKAPELEYIQQVLSNLELAARPGVIIDVDPLNVM